MEAPPRGGGAPLGRVRPGRSRYICVTVNDTLSALVLPHTSSSAWAGCHGTDVAEASSVCISPNCSAPGSSGESTPGGVCLLLVAPFWPARVWFSDLVSLLNGSPLEIPIRRDLLSQAGGHYLSPPPGVMETVGVAPEGAQLIASGLSTEVVQTILQSRAPATRKLYTLK